MTKVHPLQSDFSAGEVSPRVNARSDLPVFSKALQKCQNMLPLRQGPVVRRQGSLFVNNLLGTVGRLFHLQVDQSLSFVIVASDDGTLTVQGATGNIISDNIVLNGHFNDGLTDWVDGSNGRGAVNWDNGVALLQAERVTENAVLSQVLTIVAGNENEDHLLTIEGSPGLISPVQEMNVFVGNAVLDGSLLTETVVGNTTFVYNPGGAATVTLTFQMLGLGGGNDAPYPSWDLDFTGSSDVATGVGISFAHPWNTSDLSELQAESPPQAQEVYFVCSRVTPQVLTYIRSTTEFISNGTFDDATDWTLGTGWTIAAGLATSDGTQVGDSDLTQTPATNLVESENFGTSFTVSGITAGGVRLVIGDTLGTLRTTNGTFSEVIAAGAGADIDIRADLDFVGSVDNISVKLDSAEIWAFNEVVFTNKPVEWADFNFPSAMSFFQGRSWWAGTPGEPETFWASQSGIILNMDQGTSLDSEALQFTLARKGKIEWIEGVKNLLIGSSTGEFIVTSAEGIITPSDIQVEQQSSYGSNSTQAVPIGNDILYISGDGSKMYKINFSWTEDGWLSQDLTFWSEHLALLGRIREIQYVKNPESFLAVLLDDGSFLTCTYDPTNGILGWARHVMSEGAVSSITVTESRGVSVLWMLIQRGIADPPELYLEKFEREQLQIVHLDSRITQISDPASVNISAPHLADQLVQILADGATHASVQLDSAGDGTLDRLSVVTDIGFDYISEMTTLPQDQPGGGNSAMGFQKRWNRIFLRLLDSALPLVNGERPPDRTPATPMNTREPDQTRDIEVRDLGWDEFGRITVTMELPLKLTVAGIFGESNMKVIHDQ